MSGSRHEGPDVTHISGTVRLGGISPNLGDVLLVVPTATFISRTVRGLERAVDSRVIGGLVVLGAVTLVRQIEPHPFLDRTATSL
jgi:hypothetical protein